MAAIQWFPGHMAKAQREIEEKLKLVDVVLELIDARIPFSSINPNFENLLKNKAKLVVMTKVKMADPVYNNKWKEAVRHTFRKLFYGRTICCNGCWHKL